MDAYKNIHKQDTDKWPDLLHGLEISMAGALLQRYINGNFWRTAWCTDSAGNALNKSIEAIFAISFELEERKKTTRVTSHDRKPNDGDDKKKDDDEKEKKILRKIGTFGKGTFEKIKKAAEKVGKT